MHVGSRPDSGHYRTFGPLLGAGEQPITRVYAADDNRSAECLELARHPQLQEQAYLVFLSIVRS